MTASRALRGSALVLPATRERIERAAAQVGYQPNPHVARLMEIVRSAKTRKIRASIAVIREEQAGDQLQDRAYQYVSIESIRARAAQHGYHAEEFWLGRAGLTASRLERILRARDIEGVIVSRQSKENLTRHLDFSKFATATFGYGLAEPALHRASTNMTQGILTTIAELQTRGYRRIGLAISSWIDTRADHTYSGALLHFQQTTLARQRVPLFLFPNDSIASGFSAFSRWMKQYQPDALITFDAYVPEWLTQRFRLRIPDEIGLVVHDWTPQMASFAGIFHRRPEVASAAVDLVATQLLHGEYGVPEVPRQILIPPKWIDGPSVAQAPSSP